MKAALRRLQRLERLKGGKRIEFWICLPDGRLRMGSEVRTLAELNDPNVSHVFITEKELDL
jgi:hypothetical protein